MLIEKICIQLALILYSCSEFQIEVYDVSISNEAFIGIRVVNGLFAYFEIVLYFIQTRLLLLSIIV